MCLQEIRSPLNVLEATEAPDFFTRALRHAADCTNLWGVTWWCSHDVDRSLADFPPLEYSLGLIDAEGRDRKSTRLNSSHVASSYAVSCLKTKKNAPGYWGRRRYVRIQLSSSAP